MKNVVLIGFLLITLLLVACNDPIDIDSTQEGIYVGNLYHRTRIIESLDTEPSVKENNRQSSVEVSFLGIDSIEFELENTKYTFLRNKDNIYTLNGNNPLLLVEFTSFKIFGLDSLEYVKTTTQIDGDFSQEERFEFTGLKQ